MDYGKDSLVSIKSIIFLIIIVLAIISLGTAISENLSENTTGTDSGFGPGPLAPPQVTPTPIPELCWDNVDNDYDEDNNNVPDLNPATGIDCNDLDCHGKNCSITYPDYICRKQSDNPEYWICADNTPPYMTGMEFIPNYPNSSVDITCRGSVHDEDPWDEELNVYIYIYTSSGESTSSTKSCTKNEYNQCPINHTLSHTKTKPADNVTCEMTPNDGEDTGETGQVNTTISNYAPSIDVNITPDYYKLYNESDFVTYSNIFPTQFVCGFKVDDPDEEDDTIQINYIFKVYNSTDWRYSGGEWITIANGIFSCGNHQECTEPIPPDQIMPGNKVSCSAFPIDPHNLEGNSDYSERNAPTFDLIIKDVDAIQVIESNDLPLISYKPTMIRTELDIVSDLIDEADNVEIKVNIKTSGNNQNYYETGNAYHLLPISDLKNQVTPENRKPPYIPFSPEYQLNKIKLGEESINIFKVVQPKGSDYKVTVSIESQIKENNYDNNNKSKSYNVQDSRTFYIVGVVVNLVDKKGDKVRYCGAECKTTLIKNVDFIRQVFPINNVFVGYWPNRGYWPDISYIPPSEPSFAGPKKGIKTILFEVDLNKIKNERKYFGYMRSIRRKLFNILEDERKMQGADYVIAVVNNLLWIKDEYGGLQISKGLSYPDRSVALIEKGASKGTAAHEYLHTKEHKLYLDENEDYIKYPYHGRLGSKGWRLHPDIGTDQGRIINIWTEYTDPPEAYYIGERDSREKGRNVISWKNRYFDFMGETGVEENEWIREGNYEYLIDYFKEEE